MNNSVIYKQQTGLYVETRKLDIKSLRFLKVFKHISVATLRTALVIAVILSAFTVITSNTDYLGMKSFTVLSGSMEPSIMTGSVIYTMKNLGYNLNDVITYKTATGQMVTHRIVAVENTGEVTYRTRGDANSAIDSTPITSDMIVGKTYFAIPFIGKVGAMLKDPKGLFAVVFLPAIIVILYELWTIKKEIEKNVERKLLARLKEQGGVPPHSLWPESTSLPS